jgi:glycosyltransferase involved in cell wall biosynthesis
VVPPAITLPDEARVHSARANRADSTGPVVAFAGRLEPERRLDTLVTAASIVRRTLPECRFLIAGAGSAENKLRALADAVGVGDCIEWLGWVHDSYSVLERANIYVNTWADEAFGMAMAEAMAMELPVIGPAAGANIDLIDHGVTGMTFRREDPAALAAAIVEIAGDAALTGEMGRAARKKATRAFGSAVTASEHLRIYDECRRGDHR